MAKSNAWKTGGLAALICIFSLVFSKIERAKRYEENGKNILLVTMMIRE